MNKALLIIICDFLLLSLLPLAKFDITSTADKALPEALNIPSDKQELADVLSLALEEERQSRAKLAEELNEARQSLQSREELLAERERREREFQEDLRRREAEAQRLAGERSSLQQQFSATRSDLDQLQQQLDATSSDAKVSKQRLAEMQRELERRQAEAARLQKQMAELERIRQAAEAEKQRIVTQLQLSETEKRLAREALAAMQQEVQTVREEKGRIQEHATKLAEGVTTLAESSKELAQEVRQTSQQLAQEVRQSSKEITQEVRQGSKELAQEVRQGSQELAQEVRQGSQELVQEVRQGSKEVTEEIRQNRPLAPNEIFNDFRQNRVHSDFQAVRGGLFGREVSQEKTTRTVLVSDGSKTYALYHIHDTPLAFEDPGTNWRWLTGNLRRRQTVIPIEQISFLTIDPRVVLIPVTSSEASELGAKVYSISKEPFKFQGAVVVGVNEGYYGECNFQLDPELADFVKMDRSVIKGLFGKFNPSRGDLVFTKSGTLLGVMVNNEYCALLNHLTSGRTIRTGTDIISQQTGILLAHMRARLNGLPFKLQ